MYLTLQQSIGALLLRGQLVMGALQLQPGQDLLGDVHLSVMCGHRGGGQDDNAVQTWYVVCCQSFNRADFQWENGQGTRVQI